MSPCQKMLQAGQAGQCWGRWERWGGDPRSRVFTKGRGGGDGVCGPAWPHACPPGQHSSALRREAAALGTPQGRSQCSQVEGDTPDPRAAEGLIRDLIEGRSQHAQIPVNSHVGGRGPHPDLRRWCQGAIRATEGTAERSPPRPHLLRSSALSLRAGSLADSSFWRKALASVHAARPSPMKAFRVG